MMVPCWLQGLLIFLFLLNPVSLIARNQIRVDEGKTRLILAGNSRHLKLAVAGDFIHDVPVRVELEFLDPNDGLIQAVSHDTILSHRSGQLDIPLTGSFLELPVNSLWIRLRYRVTAGESGQEPAEARGVLSISEIGSETFVLRVGSPSYAVEGTRTRIHVFTQHPASGQS